MQRSQPRTSSRQGASRPGRTLHAFVALAIVGATGLVVLDTAMWFRLERAMDRRLDAFATQARSAGWHFTAEAGERGGWPLAATLTLRHPSLRYVSGIVGPNVAVGKPNAPAVDNPPAPSSDLEPVTTTAPGPSWRAAGPGVGAEPVRPVTLPPDDADGRNSGSPAAAGGPPAGGNRTGRPIYRFGWSGDALTLSVSPWRPRQTTLLATGTQSLSFSPDAGLPMPLRFWGARIAVTLPARADEAIGGPIVMEADALHLALPGAGPDDVIRVAGTTGRLRWNMDTASVSLVLREIALPVTPGRPDDRIVQRASAEFMVRQATARGPGEEADGPAWARPGETVTLQLANLDWDGVGAALAGSARLQVDGTLSGRFGLTVDDADQILRKMRDGGLIAPGTAVAARAVAGLITKAAPGPQLRLTLTLEDDTLKLGQIPLLHAAASTTH